MKKEADFKQDIANNKTTKPTSQRNTNQANSQQNPESLTEILTDDQTDSKSSANFQRNVPMSQEREHHEEKEGTSDVDNNQDSQVRTKESGYPEEQYLKTSLGVDDFKEAAVIASATRDPKTYVSYWDCGGDEEYHATHHIHLSSDAVYILTFNMVDIISNDGRWMAYRITQFVFIEVFSSKYNYSNNPTEIKRKGNRSLMTCTLKQQTV